MWEITIVLLLVYNFRAAWSVCKFMPDRSIFWKWDRAYPEELSDLTYWRETHPEIFEQTAKHNGDRDTYANDGFHLFQGAANFVVEFGLFWLEYGFLWALLITPVVFMVLESLVFNPLFHWVYKRRGYTDLYRSSPWKYILKNPKKGV